MLLATVLFTVWSSSASLADLDGAVGEQLFENTELADEARGWVLRGAEVVEGAGPDGEDAVVLSAAENPNAWTHFGAKLAEPPPLTELKLEVFAQARVGASVSINSFAYGAENEILERWSQAFPTETEEWHALEASYVVPKGTQALTIFVINQNSSDVLVARPSLTTGERALSKNLWGPGVLRAFASTSVRVEEEGTVGRVLFPVPLPTEHQVPLTFEVATDPPSALQSFRWLPREDGRNWLCEVVVAPEGDGTLVRWESLVLVRDGEEQELPFAEEPEVPAEAEGWLQSTACIQSEDKAIAAKAKQLAGADVGSTVANVLQFVSQNRGTGEAFVTLDAKNALGCGGSCTSRANLAAALLRADGIPARTSAHLPTWSGPLYEHWHVEYWHPGAGWTWIEPTLGLLRPKPWSLVVLNIANPEDEQQGFDPIIAHSNVMLGVPRYAVHEHSKELVSATYEWHAEHAQMNEARAAGLIDPARSEALFALAEEQWKGLIELCQAGELDPERTARVEAALASDGVTAAVFEALDDEH